MSAILDAILPIVLIVFVGFIAQHHLSLERKSLSQLAVYILAPALIASTLYQTRLSVQSGAKLVLGYIIIFCLLYFIAWGSSKICEFSAASRASFVATILFPNSTSMGLPVIIFALGEEGLERGVIYLLCTGIAMYILGPALLCDKGMSYGLSVVLKSPLLWSAVTGLSLRLLGIKFPFKLDTAITQMGEAAIPIMLIVLGLQLSSTPFKMGGYEFLAASIRLVIAPLVAYTVALVLGLQGLDLQVLVLQSSMPTSVASVVLVTEFGSDVAMVAKTVVISTLISFVTIPVVLGFLL